MLLASGGEDVVEFVEKLREKGVEVRSKKRECFDLEGCYGYVAEMLSAGFCYPAMREEEKRVFANLTTKSWAYLLYGGDLQGGNMAIAQTSSVDVLQQSCAQRPGLSVLTKVIPISGVQFVELIRKAQKIGPSDKLYLAEDPSRLFELNSFFPDPKTDFLLYLGSAGSLTRPGLLIEDRLQNDVRVPVAYLVERVFSFRHRSIQSTNSKIPKWGLHEMIVYAAFMAASNSGPLGGSSLEDLITRFVAELVDSE